MASSRLPLFVRSGIASELVVFYTPYLVLLQLLDECSCHYVGALFWCRASFECRLIDCKSLLRSHLFVVEFRICALSACHLLAPIS